MTYFVRDIILGPTVLAKTVGIYESKFSPNSILNIQDKGEIIAGCSCNSLVPFVFRLQHSTLITNIWAS